MRTVGNGAGTQTGAPGLQGLWVSRELRALVFPPPSPPPAPGPLLRSLLPVPPSLWWWELVRCVYLEPSCPDLLLTSRPGSTLTGSCQSTYGVAEVGPAERWWTWGCLARVHLERTPAMDPLTASAWGTSACPVLHGKRLPGAHRVSPLRQAPSTGHQTPERLSGTTEGQGAKASKGTQPGQGSGGPCSVAPWTLTVTPGVGVGSPRTHGFQGDGK